MTCSHNQSRLIQWLWTKHYGRCLCADQKPWSRVNVRASKHHHHVVTYRNSKHFIWKHSLQCWKIQYAILAKRCWYLSSIANQMTSLLPCSWSNVLIGWKCSWLSPSQYCSFVSHLRSLDCVQTLVECRARGQWREIRWIWQKVYGIRITDCAFKGLQELTIVLLLK